MQDVKTGVQHTMEKGTWTVFPDYCKGCALCMAKCPTNAIDWSDRLGPYGARVVALRPEKCIVCGKCESVCPDVALKVIRTKKQ